MRSEGRLFNQLRETSLLAPLQKYAKGSVLMQSGNTLVNCAVSIEDKVPPFLNPLTDGWLTCEYSMLPASTPTRAPREASKGKQGGRTIEIQRLIGRALRTVVDLKKIPGKTIWVDCDVLQADGGTRTASITGSSVALNLAISRMLKEGLLQENPQIEHVCAVSLGLVKGELLLDLDYSEDSKADVDMNLVMTESGKFVEVQMSSEENPFTQSQLESLISLGKSGIQQILELQKNYLCQNRA